MNGDIFNLTYIFDFGSNSDCRLDIAPMYLDLLGTEDMTPEQIKQEFYKLACSYNITVGLRRTYITLSGLSENMPKALELFEKLLAEAKPNQETYNKLVERILKSRQDVKANQRVNFSRLTKYAMFGENNPAKNILSEQELKSADSKMFTAWSEIRSKSPIAFSSIDAVAPSVSLSCFVLIFTK